MHAFGYSLLALNLLSFCSAQTEGFRRAAQLLLEAIDTTKNPCDNFYEYACGKWKADHPLTEDQVIASDLSELEDIVTARMKTCYESCDHSTSRAIESGKRFYEGCVARRTRDRPRRNYELIHHLVNFGYWPIIQPKWSRWDFDLTQLFIHVMKTGFQTHMVLIDVQDDFDDNTKRLIYVTQEDPPLQQGYEPKDEDERSALRAYETMMLDAVKILAADAKSCVTDAEIQADVKSIIEFERQLSKIINPDPDKLAGVQIDFVRLLREVLPPDIASSVGGNFEVSVPEAPFLQKLNSLLQRTDSRTVTNYLLWRYVKDNMDEGIADQRLSDVVQQQDLFAYRRKHRRHKLRRALGVSDRESACITETQKRLGNIAGAIYARRYFTKADRAPVCQEMKDLKEAFRQILQQNTWMDDNTKLLAVTKLDNMLLNAGAPDQVYDDQKLDQEYHGLDFHYSDSYATMKHKMTKWTSDASLSEVNRTVNRREKYLLAPTEINAFAAQNANAVFLLAGILQQPLVYNYGAIGSIVGHELTHNYDNIGALFDQVGNQKQWWDVATFQEFETRKQCLIDQYSKFTVPEASNEKVDGEKTQGENIGDLGGVKEAFLAFQNHIRQAGPEPALPGLERYTPQQLFFLAMARSYCQNVSPLAAKYLLSSDEHSPNRFRVNGVVQNSPEFSAAFSCPSGSPMNPVNKCVIW